MKSAFWVVILVLILCGLSNTTFAATYYVSPNGTDSNSGTITSPWKTLVFAEKQLAPGDILILRGGTYQNGCTIDVPNVTFQNYPNETPIIDGDWLRPTVGVWGGLITITADHITLDGIAMTESVGFGVEAYNATYATIKNCEISYTDNSGIRIGRPSTDCYNTIDNCTVMYGNYCRDRGSCSDWSFIRNNISIMGRYNTIKNCTVAYGISAGIEGYTDEYTTVENNIVYGNRLSQIHFAMANYATVRYNLIYGTDRSSTDFPTGDGDGISLCSELWYDATNWDKGHRVYGNLIANTRNGIHIGWAKGKSTGVVGKDYFPDNQIRDFWVYNNTIIEPSQDNGSSEFGHVISMNDNKDPWGTKHFGPGHVIKNNIFWQSGSKPITYGSINTSMVTMGNNLWSKKPATDGFKSPTDPNYPDYPATMILSDYIGKADNWDQLVGNSLSGREFRLLPKAVNAIRKGDRTPVPSPVSEFLDLTSVDFHADRFPMMRQPGETAWDIGAGTFCQRISAPAQFQIISLPSESVQKVE